MENEEEEQIVGLNDVDSAIIGKKTISPKQKIIIFSAIGIISFIIIITVILIIVFSKSNSDKNLVLKGVINCLYNIDKTSSKTQILGVDYSKSSNLELFIDGEKIKYSKEYQFSTIGMHNVSIYLYDNKLNMDKMFQNINNIISVEFTPEGNQIINIVSMISTFEGCEKLNDFKIGINSLQYINYFIDQV